MLLGAIFAYEYHAYGNPYLDSDIVYLTMFELEYVKEVDHTGTQSLYSVIVDLGEVSYPVNDPIWRDPHNLRDDQSINLDVLDQKLSDMFDEALHRCKPECYQDKPLVIDGRLFHVTGTPNISKPFFEVRCDSYHLDLTTVELFEAYYEEYKSC